MKTNHSLEQDIVASTDNVHQDNLYESILNQTTQPMTFDGMVELKQSIKEFYRNGNIRDDQYLHLILQMDSVTLTTTTIH